MWTAVSDQIMISCIERVFQKQDAGNVALNWMLTRVSEQTAA